MIEILLFVAVSTKMPSPPPPPPPLPTENTVGLPGRETFFVKEAEDLPAEEVPSSDYVQELPNSALAKKDYNRRGNRNH